MNLRNAMHLSSVAMVLVGGASLMAQSTTGALNGRVTDASGKPVVGARISLESPTLFQPRVLTTNAQGDYRALLLPVGNYKITVSASGFNAKTAQGVRVGVGSNQTLDFAMKPISQAGQVVEVVTDAASESKTSDKVSINYSSEQLLQLPTNRSFDGAMSLAPGVSGSMGGATMRGSQTNEVVYRIDGLDVRNSMNDSAPGGNQAAAAIYEPLPDSIEDVQVVLTALNARNGRATGGQVNVATKSGSNTFEGSARLYIYRNSWRADNSESSLKANDDLAQEDFSRYADLTFSGPVIKDRLWFYFGTRLQPGSSRVAILGLGARTSVGSPNDPVPYWQPGMEVNQAQMFPQTTWGSLPNVDAVILRGPNSSAADTYSIENHFKNYGLATAASTTFKKYEGKLTGMINDSNVLSLTLMHQRQEQGGIATEGQDTWITTDTRLVGPAVNTVDGWTLGWNCNLASNWTLEARASKINSESKEFSGGPSNGIPIISYLAAGYDVENGEPGVWVNGSDEPVARGTAGAIFKKRGVNQYPFPGQNLQTWWHSPDQGFYGPINVSHTAGAINPLKSENRSYNVNVKTFQELAGQHEIDFGFDIFETITNMGRTVAGNAKIMGGTAFTDDSGNVKLPVYYQTGGGMSTLLPGNNSRLYQWGRQPIPTMEKFWAISNDAKNKSNAFWINDIWTVNSNWSVLVGVRFNKLTLGNTDGSDLSNMSIAEPRFQVKWNPDGRGKEVLSLSYAKLASMYSDALARSIRGNEFESLSNLSWIGLHDANGDLVQPPVDNLTGTPGGNDGGQYGVRWVTPEQLRDTANWGAASSFRDGRKLYDVSRLKAPYANELQFSYERNYETGYFRLNLVERKYKNEIVQWVRDYSAVGGQDTTYLVEVKNPDPKATDSIYTQRNYWLASDNTRTFRSVEASWQKKLNQNLSFGGSYAYARTTGKSDLDYYNYLNLRTQKLSAAQQANAVGEGVLQHGQTARLHLTFEMPVGRGNVSASVLGSFNEAPVGVALYGTNSYSGLVQTSARIGDPVTGVPVEQAKGFSGVYDRTIYAGAGNAGWHTPIYRNYYAMPGTYKTNLDTYSFDARLQAQVPVGVGKTMLVAYIQINNIFNHLRNTTWNDFNNSQPGSNEVTGGRVLQNVANWGPGPNAVDITGMRTVSQLSVGIKF